MSKDTQDHVQDAGHDHDHQDGHDHQHEQESSGGTVSEGGSSALNADTALGGADAVPETPDVNDDIEDDQDLNVQNPDADGTTEPGR
ncbi:hypothetical protein [Serinicoccus sp. LYQ131]|uniref:hypothetical protein n=1 Tax=Serinicoccus sp. LYQ131 TaxID=3378797 RepID=UPI0038539E8E